VLTAGARHLQSITTPYWSWRLPSVTTFPSGLSKQIIGFRLGMPAGSHPGPAIGHSHCFGLADSNHLSRPSRLTTSFAFFGSWAPVSFRTCPPVRFTSDRYLSWRMAYYMCAAIWDRGILQNRTHGPKRGTPGANNLRLSSGTVRHLGQFWSGLGPGSDFGGVQRSPWSPGLPLDRAR
jgi:hypothetical protein